MNQQVTKRRIERMNKRLMQALGSTILMSTGNPIFKQVSITAVETSKDYKHAKVSFSLFEEDRADEAKRALMASEAFFRQKVTEAVDLPYTPKLNFVFDKTLAEASKVVALMGELKRERGDQSDE